MQHANIRESHPPVHSRRHWPIATSTCGSTGIPAPPPEVEQDFAPGPRALARAIDQADKLLFAVERGPTTTSRHPHRPQASTLAIAPSPWSPTALGFWQAVEKVW